ncbi:MAG: sugar transferase, partial [Clostridia bacterium]|nr:sugar transferase [Clostridia bacterium]
AQLFNVIRGDMSIVGPRPAVESEIDFFGEYRDILLSVKPGITGYWQVNGRSNCTYESGERQRLELYYVTNRSVALDIKILFKTVFVILKGTGAK